jgi:hypothetical protein
VTLQMLPGVCLSSTFPTVFLQGQPVERRGETQKRNRSSWRSQSDTSKEKQTSAPLPDERDVITRVTFQAPEDLSSSMSCNFGDEVQPPIARSGVTQQVCEQGALLHFQCRSSRQQRGQNSKMESAIDFTAMCHAPYVCVER